MSEDSKEEKARALNEEATRAGRAKMEFAAYAGVHKKESRNAFKDVMHASLLIDRYVDSDSDTKREITDELASLIKAEWIREPDFDKLYLGMDFYDYAPIEFMQEATPAEKLAGEYFFNQIVKPVLNKHKIKEAELVDYAREDERAVAESRLFLVRMREENK